MTEEQELIELSFSINMSSWALMCWGWV